MIILNQIIGQNNISIRLNNGKVKEMMNVLEVPRLWKLFFLFKSKLITKAKKLSQNLVIVYS
jgi:hypothetical protein